MHSFIDSGVPILFLMPQGIRCLGRSHLHTNHNILYSQTWDWPHLSNIGYEATRIKILKQPPLPLPNIHNNGISESCASRRTVHRIRPGSIQGLQQLLEHYQLDRGHNDARQTNGVGRRQEDRTQEGPSEGVWGSLRRTRVCTLEPWANHIGICQLL